MGTDIDIFYIGGEGVTPLSASFYLRCTQEFLQEEKVDMTEALNPQPKSPWSISAAITSAGAAS
jgi:hypothetical protein